MYVSSNATGSPLASGGALEVVEVGLGNGLAEIRVHGGLPAVEFWYYDHHPYPDSSLLLSS